VGQAARYRQPANAQEGVLEMVRYFDDAPSQSTRASQVWQILVSKAMNRQTLTYGQLASLLGFERAGVLAHILGHIMHYCIQGDLPPLTVLVVNQSTGLPGEGLIQADLNVDREKVFGFNWFGLVPPTPVELENAYGKAK
jgi:alkylated DNA nucleotide flippase Atl1